MSDSKSTGVSVSFPPGSMLGVRPVVCGVCAGMGKVTYIAHRGRELAEQCVHCRGFGIIVLEVLADDVTRD